VTQYKASNQASSVPQYYCLNIGDIFNPSTSQPCQLPPLPPGFTPIFANPIKSQVLTQPTNTELRFVGTYDFTDAAVIGIGGSGNLALTCVPQPLSVKRQTTTRRPESGDVCRM
jgi:hypothetical protein